MGVRPLSSSDCRALRCAGRLRSRARRVATGEAQKETGELLQQRAEGAVLREVQRCPHGEREGLSPLCSLVHAASTSSTRVRTECSALCQSAGCLESPLPDAHRHRYSVAQTLPSHAFTGLRHAVVQQLLRFVVPSLQTARALLLLRRRGLARARDEYGRRRRLSTTRLAFRPTRCNSC